MSRIRNQHRAICALVASRRIRLAPLTLTPTEAVKQFTVSKAELAAAMKEGLLGPSCSSTGLIPLWRLERLFPRR
jgi:hypothetical protein